ncbi:GRP family sugar transporter [Acetilactobacillus jinshanensis]|uniref:Ribose uptake protein RbsU n=1 Tax=Acetilactobacillus jinshanensis TaxID=1720083 RepID=A0A4P6ZKV1_9LACO|nr:GRP family sugar transporter [Acetilactobacillus jinshanensis]QBP18193.1 ribose uptake protein RbsU [Acetilactobacillus jinshanensis]
MGIAIALLTAVFWGCTPLWAKLFGGKPIEQLLGTTYGAFIFGILVLIFKHPEMNNSIFWWCFLAGACWSVGQLATYKGLYDLGISITTPISAGVQLVGVNLIGVMFFGSWASTEARITGFFAILLIFLGVFLTTRGDEKTRNQQGKMQVTKAVIKLLLGAGIGYTACSTLPKIPEASGWSTFPPQAIGMLVSAVAFSLMIRKYHAGKLLFSKGTLKNMITGVNSGLGSLSYLITIMLCGISTGFTLSQMSTVVSTFGGLIFFKEHRHGKTLAYTLSGLFLVVIGGVITGFI